MTVTRAWIMLLVFSAGSTALAVTGLRGTGFIVAVLALAGAKARVILANYLGLAAAPAILTGFDFVLAALLLLCAGLAIAG